MSLYDLCPDCYENDAECVCECYAWTIDQLRERITVLTNILDGKVRISEQADKAVPVCSRKPFPKRAPRTIADLVAQPPVPEAPVLHDLGHTV